MSGPVPDSFTEVDLTADDPTPSEVKPGDESYVDPATGVEPVQL